MPTKFVFLQILVKPLLLICAATMLVGCTSPKGKVIAKRDPSFEGQLQRALIACPDREISAYLGKQFAPRFLNQLTNSLAQHGVPTAFIEVDKEALDNRDLVETAANRFRAGQILNWSLAGMNTINSVRQTSPGDMLNFRSSTSVALEFGMYDVWANRVVWRARFTYDISPSPEIVASQLIDELIAAKLLIQQRPEQNR